MKKILLIGFKDVILAFRDRAALLLMLLAPFLLTVGLGFVSGRFSGTSSSAVSDIAVLLVNLDTEADADLALGQALVEVFESPELADLMNPERVDDAAQARQRVDADEAAAAVIIPAGFTNSLIPSASGEAPPTGEVVKVEIYANPARPTSASVVQTVVEEFIARLEAASIGGEVAILQMLESGRLEMTPAALEAAGRAAGEALAGGEGEQSPITIRSSEAGEEAVQFDVLAYMAPGMALMFLMYTVTYGGRSLLIERSHGTLPRLLVSPTTSAQVLGGKVLGIYLTGVAQLSILILASALLFKVSWGNPLGVAALILATVFGATGWGMLLTALARSPGQINSVGSALMLTFGILGGSFLDISSLPPLVQWVSKITPNAWGLEGFTTLALGGGLTGLAAPLIALLVMGAVLFAASVLLFNRQALAQR